MFVVLVVWLLNRVFPFLSFFSAAPFHPLSALLAQRRTRHGAGHCAAVQRRPGSLSPNRPGVDQEVGDEVERPEMVLKEQPQSANELSQTLWEQKSKSA